MKKGKLSRQIQSARQKRFKAISRNSRAGEEDTGSLASLPDRIPRKTRDPIATAKRLRQSKASPRGSKDLEPNSATRPHQSLVGSPGIGDPISNAKARIHLSSVKPRGIGSPIPNLASGSRQSMADSFRTGSPDLSTSNQTHQHSALSFGALGNRAVPTSPISGSARHAAAEEHPVADAANPAMADDISVASSSFSTDTSSAAGHHRRGFAEALTQENKELRFRLQKMERMMSQLIEQRRTHDTTQRRQAPTSQSPALFPMHPHLTAPTDNPSTGRAAAGVVNPGLNIGIPADSHQHPSGKQTPHPRKQPQSSARSRVNQQHPRSTPTSSPAGSTTSDQTNTAASPGESHSSTRSVTLEYIPPSQREPTDTPTEQSSLRPRHQTPTFTPTTRPNQRD